MELFGIKLTILLAIIAGAFFRVIRVSSNATSRFGKILDKFVIFSLSIFVALILMPPLISHFAIPLVYHQAVAMALALFSHDVVSKLIESVRTCNLDKIIRRYINNKLNRK